VPRSLPLIAAALLAALCLAAPASAAPKPVFGFGDQSASMFKDPRWSALRLRDTRLLVSWDTFSDPWKATQLQQWMTAAHAAGVRPLVAFDRSFTRVHRRVLPTPAQYVQLVRTFRAHYPWVRQFTPWNEANHQVQPTYRKPGAAARFYLLLKQECRGCTVTSPVILPAKNAKRWVARFKRAVKVPVRLWSVNDYGDFNRGTDTLLRGMLKILPGQLWVTETGGWVRFKPYLKHDERRAARAYKVILAMARQHSKRVRRWYLYQWKERPHDPVWDSGLIRANGRVRPAYGVLLKGLRAKR
jgi:hypothetical protein